MTDFSISEFLAFCRSKPAGEGYNYQRSGNCALCQFLKETGRAEYPVVTPHAYGLEGVWTDDGSDERPYDPALEQPLNAGITHIIFSHPDWTFGALADRLEALVPTEKWLKPQDYLGDYALAPLRAEPASRLGADACLPLSQKVGQ